MFYRIGNLVLRSPYSFRRPQKGEDCLILKTCRSFPPTHPSTKAALSVLQLLNVKKNTRILDIGCGSGVLGLTAALQNNTSAIGCDISLAAIRASMQNASFNQMENRLHLFHGSADAVTGKFQLILANLPPAVHTEMFDHYQRLALSGESLLIVSGFCDIHTLEIEKELAIRGFAILEKLIVNAWAAATTPEYTYTWMGLGLKKI